MGFESSEITHDFSRMLFSEGKNVVAGRSSHGIYEDQRKVVVYTSEFRRRLSCDLRIDEIE